MSEHQVAPSRHAVFGFSSAEKWMGCPGSIAMERQANAPESDTFYADEGTAAHEIAAKCLIGHKRAEEFIGQKVKVGDNEFEVDKEMAGHIQTYLDTVYQLAGVDGVIYVEQEMDISFMTGEPGAVGTSDCVILKGDTLIVVDLKFGQGKRVSAEKNKQLMGYANAAWKALVDGKLTAPVSEVATDELEGLL